MPPTALADIALSVQKITGVWRSAVPLSGGDIATLLRIEAERGQFVLKTHSSPPAGFFASEAAGLASLAGRGMRVPAVLAKSEDFLLLQFMPPGKKDYFAAGVMLGRLHGSAQAMYGAPSDSYLATIRQPNRESADWPQFFLKQRIGFCLDRLANLQPNEQERWNDFARVAKPLLATCPRPSWLHGDLWAGNLMMTAEGPALIDPACYAGDALVDVAMTRLFGGFPQLFYEGYRSVLPVREHEAELMRIYQIYPLLVHAILFDGADCRGSGYYRRAAGLRDAFF